MSGKKNPFRDLVFLFRLCVAVSTRHGLLSVFFSCVCVCVRESVVRLEERGLRSKERIADQYVFYRAHSKRQ